ncbi:MAG: hypothetical protein ACI89L_001968 [Phycisphaerales bacterium]|jgi:hypothetical protein
MIPMSPGVAFGVLLLTFISVTHLIRPDIWRDVIREWARQGAPGVTLYAMLHVIPGSVLVVLSMNDTTIAGRVVLVYGLILTIKGTVYVLLADRMSEYLQRWCAMSIARWRSPGVVGPVLVAGLVMLSRSGA